MNKTFFLCALVALLFVAAVAAKSRRMFTQGRVFDSHLREYPATDSQIKANMKQFQQFAKQNANPFDISGFFNVNKTYDANMYYVFFPSKDGNANAPIILWLQGGPGCRFVLQFVFSSFLIYCQCVALWPVYLLKWVLIELIQRLSL